MNLLSQIFTKQKPFTKRIMDAKFLRAGFAQTGNIKRASVDGKKPATQYSVPQAEDEFDTQEIVATLTDSHEGTKNTPGFFVKIEVCISAKPFKTCVKFFGASSDGKSLRGPMTNPSGLGFKDQNAAKNAYRTKFWSEKHSAFVYSM
jgi:hypothetical protein